MNDVKNGRGRVQHNLQWTSVIRNGYFSHLACVLILLRSSFPRESLPTTSLPSLSCSSIFTFFTSRITNKLPQPRKYDNDDDDDLSLAMDSYHLRFRPARSQSETLLSGTPERERADSSSSSLRKRSHYEAPGVRLREMRPRRVFTSDSCSRRARGVYKVPSNLQRKLSNRVNHNRGAVRTNPRLARVRATSVVR